VETAWRATGISKSVFELRCRDEVLDADGAVIGMLEKHSSRPLQPQPLAGARRRSGSEVLEAHEASWWR
jgi:hypothetical protein